jgi:hypothetical protein
MSSAVENVQGLLAICHFNAAGAAFIRQRGFAAAIVDNGVGDFTLTFQDAIDLAGGAAVVLCGSNAATAGSIGVEIVSATQIRIRNLDSAAMAADRNFWLAVLPVGPN